MNFALFGCIETPATRWFAEGLQRVLEEHGHVRTVAPAAATSATAAPSAVGGNGRINEQEEGGAGEPEIRLALNFTSAERPEPYRRRSQATFVVSMVEVGETPADILKAAYPLLVKSLSNLFIYMVSEGGKARETYFVTLERGHFPVPVSPQAEKEYFDYIYRRLHPLATSHLIIKNEFRTDLPPELWEGDATTEEIKWASRQLEALDLLPAPFPIQEILSEKDFRHVQHLYGIGGLSYGNLSARHGPYSYWMSASGVNKATLSTIGRDILLVTGYDPERQAMILSVPPHVEPRRVSVDAIEHWMIYTTHPQVGAIVHVHAWMEGVPSTEVNYPCGTYELATAVAELVNRAPDPGRTVVGLRNHGLTITGPSLREIFARIEGKILRQVPMS